MTGACHCGEVTVTLASRPDYINQCDCSLCAKSGGAWGYFPSADVAVTGTTESYRRSDYDQPAVELRFCPQCATTTHWVLTEHFEGDRVGVNMRIFEPEAIRGIELRFPDGRNWFGESEPVMRRAAGVLGEDAFL